MEVGSEQRFLTPLPGNPRENNGRLVLMRRRGDICPFPREMMSNFQQIPEDAPKGSHRCPKTTKGTPKDGQREPKGTPKGAKGSQREPKVGPKAAKGTPKTPTGSPKGSQRESQGAQSRPKGGQRPNYINKLPINRPSGHYVNRCGINQPLI